MVDGIAGADLLTALFSPWRSAPSSAAPHWAPRPAPPRLPCSARPHRPPGQQGPRRRAESGEWSATRLGRLSGPHPRPFWKAVGLGARPAPDSPFNRPIGPIGASRGWRSTSTSQADQESARRYGERRRARDGGRRPCGDFSCTATPTARRRPARPRTGQHPRRGRAPRAWATTWRPGSCRSRGRGDPLERLARIHAMTAALQAAHNDRLGAEMLSGAGSDARPRRALRRAAATIQRRGDQRPGSTAAAVPARGAAADVYPLVPLFPNQGLGVAVFSYADTSAGASTPTATLCRTGRAGRCNDGRLRRARRGGVPSR